MTRITAAILLFALAPSAIAQNRDLRAEIQAVNDSMVAAFNTGNMLAVSRFYTDDARVDRGVPRALASRREGRAASRRRLLPLLSVGL
jgi:hypothetical protein